jgi:hypothetical protein
MARLDGVEAGSKAFWSARRFTGWKAGDYHLALPVVAATLQLLKAHGADGRVWRRFGWDSWHTLTAALDNPDGDELLRAEQSAAQQARWARQAVERERRRLVCSRCTVLFSDERWAERERAGAWGDDALCAGCRQADADRKALEAAERERAAVEARPPR